MCLATPRIAMRSDAPPDALPRAPDTRFATMNQLLLDLAPPPHPTFDNFIVGRNVEVMASLRRLCAAPVADPPARCIYLWGEAGSGRSHLLRAACELLDGRYLSANSIPANSITAEDVRGAMTCAPSQRRCLLAIDDVEATGADVQEALLHALNAMREDPRAAIVVAGNAAPRDLKLAVGRDDLRSRLAWGLAFELHGLDDEAKDAALAHHAGERGFALAPDVRRHLLTHFARDLGSLMPMVDALDRYALEHQRVITVPLIRDYLERASLFDEPLDHAA